MEQLPFDFSTADDMALGARAFGFLSGDAAVLGRLLNDRRREDVPALLAKPDFLVRVLDELISNEAALAWFAGTVGVPVTAPYEARRRLRAADSSPAEAAVKE
jgi:hypothetical protein